MTQEPLIWLTGLGVVGYLTFHGHRWGKDCWLCNYRGMTCLVSSLGLGAFLAFSEEEPKPTYQAYYPEDSEEE